MKKLLFVIISLILCACSSIKSFAPETEFVFGSTMMNAFENYYTIEQFDSICKADTINRDLSKWTKLSLKDGETNKDVSLYLYIKSLGKYETVYRVQIINNSTYKITKRITK